MTTQTDTTQTPPPPPPARHRLERSKDDRYIGGVCGGLGRYLDIDPVIVRVAVVCLALFGAGLVMYAVAWAFIPEAGQELSVAQATRRDRSPGRELVVIIVVVLAGLAALDVGFGRNDHGGGWLVPVLVIGGFFWWRHQRGYHFGPPSPPAWPATPVPPGAPPAPSAFWAGTATAPPLSTPTTPAYAPPPGTPWGAWSPPAARPPRERSLLGTLTFSTLLVAVGIAALLDALGAISLSAQGILATALVIVGGGLLVGAWYGRSRGLIAIGLLLTLAVSAVSAVDIPLRGGSGDRTWRVTTVDQLDDGYYLRAGSGVLDLTQVEIGDGTHVVDTSLGLGELTILVPAGVLVRVTGHIGAGDASIFGRQQDGFDLDVDYADPGPTQLVINTDIGLGELKVQREAS